MSLFAPGDEVNMVNFLSDTWAKLKELDVFTKWKSFGILTGLTEKSGIFDTSPLYNTLSDLLNQSPKKI